MTRKYILLIFLLVVLIQIYVPAKMIFDREAILATGRKYKFKSAPLDPVDPFRGKYITLDYEQNSFRVQDGEDWNAAEDIYVHLSIDKKGFAKIQTVSRQKPRHNTDFVKARVRYVLTDKEVQKILIEYPFDRFYMEEAKAYEAELAYRESLRDTSRTTYALVAVKNGDAVLKDVFIDKTSIREIMSAKSGKNP